MNESFWGMGLIILLDRSASTGVRGGQQAIHTFISEFKALWNRYLKDLQATSLCQLALIDHHVHWQPTVPLYEVSIDAHAPQAQAGSSLGQGLWETGSHLSELMSQLMIQENAYGLLRPIILLISDGWSTDDPDQGLQALRQTYWGKQAHLRAVFPPAAEQNYCQRFLKAFAGPHVNSVIHMDAFLREIIQTLHSEQVSKNINQIFRGEL
jgi:uncharacterized protein YegL